MGIWVFLLFYFGRIKLDQKFKEDLKIEVISSRRGPSIVSASANEEEPIEPDGSEKGSTASDKKAALAISKILENSQIYCSDEVKEKNRIRVSVRTNHIEQTT